MNATGEAVGLLLDTGHLVFAGGDNASVIARHGKRINHFHNQGYPALTCWPDRPQGRELP
jgi:hypothetical protein